MCKKLFELFKILTHAVWEVSQKRRIEKTFYVVKKKCVVDKLIDKKSLQQTNPIVSRVHKLQVFVIRDQCDNLFCSKRVSKRRCQSHAPTWECRDLLNDVSERDREGGLMTMTWLLHSFNVISCHFSNAIWDWDETSFIHRKRVKLKLSLGELANILYISQLDLES